jgi:hypothetical protein
MVAADFDDQDSLKSALIGANAIFVVTDCYEPFVQGIALEKA